MKLALIACESSGTVREAINRIPGWQATSCDLQPADDGGRHIQADVLTILDDGWDLMVAHPPCQFVAVSGMHRTTRGLRPRKSTDDAIAFAERLWESRISRIAIENPVGVLSTQSRLGKFTQMIQPYEFGHDASKRTCLWLRGLPKLALDPALYIKPRMVCKCGKVHTYEEEFKHGCPDCGVGTSLPRWANQTDSGQNRLPPSEDRWKLRSKTYQGIADAMAAQWTI